MTANIRTIRDTSQITRVRAGMYDLANLTVTKSTMCQTRYGFNSLWGLATDVRVSGSNTVEMP